jgi:manganese/iron transport system substrate-binding protein
VSFSFKISDRRFSRWALARPWRWGWVCLGLVLLLQLSGCGTGGPVSPSDPRPQVVATSTILADFAQRLAGNTIQLTSILQPGDDPHVYEPRPADSRILETADLVLYNGYNLEPGLIRLMENNSRAPKIAVGEIIPPLRLVKPSGHNAAGPNTTGPNIEVQVPDPHVWGDVENSLKMVELVQKQLLALLKTNPAAMGLVQQNTLALLAELRQVDAWIQAQVQTVPAAQRLLVTTHDAFQYYAQAYGFKMAGTLIGISTEEQPSAQTTRNLVEAIKAAKVPAIFAETTINPNLIRTVAEEAGVQLAPRPLYSDSVGAPGSGAETYAKMMIANTETIVTALGGKLTPFRQ